MTPKVTLIIKRASSTTRWHKTPAQKTAITWWQELQNIVGIATTWQEWVYEEFPYCSPSKSSGKQKKNRSTSQPHFRSENTPTTIETDQFLMALQQLANNNNFANFHNNINRISTSPKSLTTTLPRLTGDLQSSSCLKIFSKRASKFIINWPRRTESTTSIILWREMHYIHLKTLMTLPERIWEKFWQFFERKV